ncbi:MAG TPA: nicotinamidase [Thermoanaerobaculia bacterium]|nr:nicotinamidase [Thermoanaerobaculia bacterium]
MELPLPDLFDPARADDFHYDPDPAAVLEAAAEWAVRHRLPPAGSDSESTLLLLVDLQKDFCFPEGALYVAGRSGRGAVDDNRRVAAFLYRNLAGVTATLSTLDSHLAHHIFSPTFWRDANGEMPGPHRTVTAAEVRAGEVRPAPELASWVAGGDYEWLCRQALHYCEELERRGRYALYLWPPHCLVGSPGHGMVGVVQEARLFHAYARRAEAAIEIKGLNVLTEHYSVLQPEITTAHDGTALAEVASRLAEKLLGADRLVIAGQAASHCVKNTLEDLLAWIEEHDPALARRVYVLEDCMSAVTVPDPTSPGRYLADFTEPAEQAIDRCRRAGVRVVRSTVPMAEWPSPESDAEPCS